jgi:hypothetical protein
MGTLFATPDQVRIVAIRRDAGLNDAEALARFFEDPQLSGGPDTASRLAAVLAATERGAIPGLHTGLPFRDLGFRGEATRGGPGLRDPWPNTGSVNQVGHFLTAVGLGFRPELVGRPILGRTMRRWVGAPHALTDQQVALRLTIGHELAGDPGLVLGALAGAVLIMPMSTIMVLELGRGLAAGLGILPALVGLAAGAAAEQLLGFRRQFRRAGPSDEAAFLHAAEALGPGPKLDLDAAEQALQPILGRIDVNQPGNSYQDLRLSLLGWWLGQSVRSAKLAASRDVASWVRINIQGLEA